MPDLGDVWAELRQLRQDVNRLQAGSPLESASIDRGGLTVRAEEGLTIGDRETGAGSIKVYGRFEGVGPLHWSGPVTFGGPSTLSGPVTVGGEHGALTVSKETLLRGPLSLHAGLTVKPTGSVTVEGPVPLRIRKRQDGVGQAAIELGDGDGGGAALIYAVDHGGGSVTLNLQAGRGLVHLGDDGVSLPNIDAASGPGMHYVVADASGRLMQGARQA